jgi:hypothetical protein
MKRILVIFLFAMAGNIAVLTAQTQEGRGTWYETDSKGLTASHATLPFGTRVRVTNLQNEKQVIVTIDNRIVETPNRLIDISKAAADNLEMNARGTTPVRIEVLSRRAVPASTTIITPTPTDNTPVPVTQPVEPVVNEPPVEETPVIPPPSEKEEPAVTVATTAPRPASTAPAAEPVPTNPGMVNQTIITIGTSMIPGKPGTSVVVSTDPAYATTPEGSSVIAGPQPSVTAAPAPAVVSPQPAIVAPTPAVVSPQPMVIAPVVVPPVIAQPVIAPPVLVPPVVSEPIVSEPIVAQPVISEPVKINPVPITPSTRNPPAANPPAANPPAVKNVPPAGVVPARIIPRIPDPATNKIYRIQVGAFLDERNATDAYRRLAEAGLSPGYERYNEYYRIVLTGVRANEIENIAWRLGAARFPEALLREER